MNRKKVFTILGLISSFITIIFYYNMQNHDFLIRNRSYFGYNFNVNKTRLNLALPLCPSVPNNLDPNVNPNNTILDNRYVFINIVKGGGYKPYECKPRESVAIIVPYRDREEHRTIFIKYMHNFLQKQQVSYKIYFVEMAWPIVFNRGVLINIGFIHAEQHNFTCYIFHDVDLLPTNENNFYRCNNSITHFNVNNSKIGYKIPYMEYTGGVLGFPGSLFRRINGYSNSYFGWGGEDDDVSRRLCLMLELVSNNFDPYETPSYSPSHKDQRCLDKLHHSGIRYAGLGFNRRAPHIGVYQPQPHDRDKGNPTNPKRWSLLNAGKTVWKKDGLNTLQYDLIAHEERELYTWIYVKVNETEIAKSVHMAPTKKGVKKLKKQK